MPPVFDIAASANSYPFRYSDDEWTNLGALAIEQQPDDAGRLRSWPAAYHLVNEHRLHHANDCRRRRGIQSGIRGGTSLGEPDATHP